MDVFQDPGRYLICSFFQGSSGTGTYGTGIPEEGGIILDLSGMNRVTRTDTRNRWVLIEAGEYEEAEERALNLALLFEEIGQVDSHAAALAVAEGHIGSK